jgi:hypothetical protein
MKLKILEFCMHKFGQKAFIDVILSVKFMFLIKIFVIYKKEKGCLILDSPHSMALIKSYLTEILIEDFIHFY